MRLTWGKAAIALVCVSCGADNSQKQNLLAVEVSAEAQGYSVYLLPDGIQVPGKPARRLPFGSDEASVRGFLDTALGEAEDVLEGKNCEDAPLRMAEYPGDVAFHFRGGKLVGWGAQDSRDPSAATPEGITTDSDLKKAEEVYDLERAFFPSPLGAEYTTDDGYSFFVGDMGEGPSILWFFAGAVCFR